MNLIHTLNTMWILYAKTSPLARIKKFTFITLEFEIVQSFFIRDMKHFRNYFENLLWKFLFVKCWSRDRQTILSKIKICLAKPATPRIQLFRTKRQAAVETGG